MSSLGFWSMLAIMYQTVLCVIISWLTLACKFIPDKEDLHEVILLKMAYLYDPIACGSIHFYNITALFNNGNTYSNVVWPTTNDIAANFRVKMQLWLALHLIWTFFAIINVSQGQRSCGFYATLVPFTISGVALLTVDFIYCVLFLLDARDTYSEAGILRLLAVRGHLRGMTTKLKIPAQLALDETSWISALFAYVSIRGVVQWLVNFWIVKDNYFDGLGVYLRNIIHYLVKCGYLFVYVVPEHSTIYRWIPKLTCIAIVRAKSKAYVTATSLVVIGINLILRITLTLIKTKN